MSNESPWTRHRERVFLDIASMIGTLAGFLLILFSENARSPLYWWLGIAVWVIAIVLAIAASLLSPNQQPRWRQRIRGTLLISLSGSSISLVFAALAVVTRQDLLIWLGIITIPVVLFPGMFILERNMRRRMKAQGEEQQASR